MYSFSSNTIVISACLLLTGVSSTINANTSQQANNTVNPATQQISYTANGTTDVKTAQLFKHLMKHNKNLKIHAKVIKKPASSKTGQVNVAVNYTVHGKTDMKTVRKLIKLFKTNKEVQITANVKVNTNIAKRQNNLYNKPAFSYYGYPPVNYTNYYYPGFQPIMHPQRNSAWYPTTPKASQEIPQYPELPATNAPFPMDHPTDLKNQMAAK